jgi:hypothetical protein
MNPAIHAAIVAAQSTETVDTAVAKLKAAGALGPENAIALPEMNAATVDEALAAGLIVRSSDGHYYLDEQAVSDRNERNGMMLLVSLLIMASLAASVIALLAFR